MNSSLTHLLFLNVRNMSEGAQHSVRCTEMKVNRVQVLVPYCQCSKTSTNVQQGSVRGLCPQPVTCSGRGHSSLWLRKHPRSAAPCWNLTPHSHALGFFICILPVFGCLLGAGGKGCVHSFSALEFHASDRPTLDHNLLLKSCNYDLTFDKENFHFAFTS